MAAIINTTYLKSMKLYDSNGVILHEAQGRTEKEKLKSLYSSLGLKYPKFHKMNSLSKSSFLCAETLLSGIDYNKYDFEKIGIFIANKSSSLQTDTQYYTETFNTTPLSAQPGLFVYTLPNILLGELSIRFGFKGEQCMWINDRFDSILYCNYVDLLLGSGKIDAAVIGWAEVNEQEQEVFLSWIDGKNKEKNLDPTDINKFYEKLKTL